MKGNAGRVYINIEATPDDMALEMATTIGRAQMATECADAVLNIRSLTANALFNATPTERPLFAARTSALDAAVKVIMEIPTGSASEICPADEDLLTAEARAELLQAIADGVNPALVPRRHLWNLLRSYGRLQAALSEVKRLEATVATAERKPASSTKRYHALLNVLETISSSPIVTEQIAKVIFDTSYEMEERAVAELPISRQEIACMALLPWPDWDDERSAGAREIAICQARAAIKRFLDIFWSGGFTEDV